MTELVAAEGATLDRILDETYAIWSDGLSRHAYGRYYAAQVATPWGRAHLKRYALVDDDEVLASAKVYRFPATLDRRPIELAGIGAVFTSPARRRRGAGRELLERLLERATAEGADLALLFSEIGPEFYARLGFATVPTVDRQLRVTESIRYGAPMTMVRAGDDRDLKDIVAMNVARAEPYRFHLNRDRDVIHFALARRRLLAGLGPSGARVVHYFIAEEGASAVAYLVITAQPGAWRLEEAGDRDPAGARAGAMLQALIAREPAERRPVIEGWLPDGVLPPHGTILGEEPSADVMMIKPLTARGRCDAPLTAADVCYWRADAF